MSVTKRIWTLLIALVAVATAAGAAGNEELTTSRANTLSVGTDSL